ncbi:MAG: hypothetical protein AVDCRST_MAG19-3873 [uncultured Thermomicrobiales bacterium]|uniref:Uncharacterized protein n=1 Tax=uncultured Thermomicrobiales bacterium TaxID=1645740 RepID=A0A6J4VJD7_9BACT|nr:MAG: hypothetical protein AVDCRST_MAG19-3873 [uncultured Thermomicrobiales bacterium]
MSSWPLRRPAGTGTGFAAVAPPTSEPCARPRTRRFLSAVLLLRRLLRLAVHRRSPERRVASVMPATGPAGEPGPAELNMRRPGARRGRAIRLTP